MILNNSLGSVFAVARQLIRTSFYRLRCLPNRVFLVRLIRNKPMLHIGCGDKRISGCINTDIKPTKATDLVADCSSLSIFGDNSFKTVFSNAFFEHLYFNQRLTHLKKLYRILNSDGHAIYLGIPDFEAIAKHYVKKSPGILNKTFNIDEVYRYTHGNPEQMPAKYWLFQLHKSLADHTAIEKLMRQAGFKSYSIFRYAFRREKLAITLGFIAFKEKPLVKLNSQTLLRLVEPFSTDIRYGTVEFLKEAY